MKCPKCGAPMRTDYDENQWYCQTVGCMTFYYARDIPGLIAERDALVAERREVEMRKTPSQQFVDEALKHIDKLTAERDALAAQLELEAQCQSLLRDERDALAAENERLREVAKAALSFIDDDADPYPPPGGYTTSQMKAALNEALK